jgi:hypothetical protein
MKRTLFRAPILGRIISYLLRLKIAAGLFFSYSWVIGKWFVSSREYTNFTYALTPENVEDLADFVSVVTGEKSSIAKGFIDEIQQDSQLRKHIENGSKNLPFSDGADKTIHFARRIGWYALVRVTKPVVVVETGIDKGLGSCVIAAALKKNHADGISGKLLAVDINPNAGGLINGEYGEFVEKIFSDSLAAIDGMTQDIDLFIHDSDHSFSHEASEYERLVDRLSAKSLVISDNAHVSRELRQFANRVRRKYLFWSERPAGHFYPGGGIGAAYLDQ